jgi:hypothetical protein
MWLSKKIAEWKENRRRRKILPELWSRCFGLAVSGEYIHLAHKHLQRKQMPGKNLVIELQISDDHSNDGIIRVKESGVIVFETCGLSRSLRILKISKWIPGKWEEDILGPFEMH